MRTPESRHQEWLRRKERLKALPYDHPLKVKSRASCQTYKKGHPEETKMYDKLTRPRYLVQNRQRVARWKRANPGKVTLQIYRRRALKKGLLHLDLDRALETEFSVQIALILATGGIRWHVDHIIPLSAGGWHHHLNLQLLPPHLNATKHNDPFWTHPWFKSWRDVPQFLWPESLCPQYLSILESEKAAIAA